MGLISCDCLPQWLFAPNAIAPAFNPAQPPAASPLQGCGLISVATDDGHTVRDLRKRERYCGSMGLKICVCHEFFLVASPCLTSHLPSPNSDPTALGHRCAICTPIVYRCPHECALPTCCRRHTASSIYATSPATSTLVEQHDTSPAHAVHLSPVLTIFKNKRTNMLGVSHATLAPTLRLANIKDRWIEQLRSIVDRGMRCCHFQTHR